MRFRYVLILLIIIFVFVPLASADYNSSGTIEYYFGESTSYDLTAGVWSPDMSLSQTTFGHRFTDAKLLNRVIFSDASALWYSTLTYTKNDVSPFTAEVGGIYYGYGVAGVYEDEFGIIYFDIDFMGLNDSYALTLTGAKWVVLTFEDSPWSGIVSSGSNNYIGYLNELTVDRPTKLKRTDDILIERGNVFTSYNSYYKNDYTYSFNSSYNISNLSITRADYESIWSVFDSNDSLYFEDDTYSTTAISQDFLRYYGVYADITFNTAPSPTTISHIIDINGTAAEPDAPPADGDFDYNITTELDEYSPGDTVNVTYTTDQKGTIQVVKTISGDIYHSIGFVSGATNATWQFYIAENEPYGFYDVFLLDSSNTILDSVRYSLLPTTSSLDILQSSVDLHETFVVFAQTVNESILSIEDPDGVEVWNVSIGALMYDYIYYTPTIKTGIYTAYLYDDSTLNDTVMVYLADPPIIDDPLDPETNGTIPIEDVLEDDESMTEYFDDKFREFAPTAWGIFLLSIILWLMAILTSFGGSSKRR